MTVTKRGTARRLGLRAPYAMPGLIIRMPKLTPEQVEEMRVLVAKASGLPGTGQWIYPSVGVESEHLRTRRLR